MKKFSILFICMIVLFGCISTEKSAEKSSAAKIEGLSLREAAVKQNMFVGSAVDPVQLDNKQYADTLSMHFNYVTAENAMKWSSLHPEPEGFAFEDADKIVEFAMANDMKVRGHTLVWHSQAPDWLLTPKTPWGKEELLAALKYHIDNVAGRYAAKVYAWDVVNEALDGSNYRKSVFYDTLGKDFIPAVFRMAHAAVPDALLYYNDYGVETVNAKSNAMYKMVKELLDQGVPIHGVGLQCHLTVAKSWPFDSFYKNIKRFVDLGLKVDITELDIKMQEPFTPEDYQLQAEMYQKLTQIMLAFPECDTFITWGFTDAVSWIPGFSPGYGDSLLFDHDYNPKPSFYAVRDALVAGPVETGYENMSDSADNSRRAIPPFVAREAKTAPVVDGVINADEWANAVNYPLGFNQLNVDDLRPPKDPAELSGEWSVLYKGNTVYVFLKRVDNVTFTKAANSYESDNVEVFFDLNGTFVQLRTLIGSDFEDSSYAGAHKAVWNKDGTVLELSIELPDANLANLIAGWNIALSDNDGESRKWQLYSITGQNDSWQGVNLGSLKFEGTSPRPPEPPRVVIPFHANESSIVKVDGKISDGEWTKAVKYPLIFNQLSEDNLVYTGDYKDFRGEWGIVYNGNTIYGYVLRSDDITYTEAPNVWENDNVEVFLDMNNNFIQLRTLVGKDWDESSYEPAHKAVWSADGTVLEFSIGLTADAKELGIIGFNIALADNDGTESRESQQYPVFGFNDCWQGINLAELQFVK
ncbi:MAG: endo-1,4-beta-xylanase [Spirochaetales bacterium]|nr:endo-1,4-beta-xylanase [Spirochaetales bacterium]